MLSKLGFGLLVSSSSGPNHRALFEAFALGFVIFFVWAMMRSTESSAQTSMSFHLMYWRFTSP